MARETREEERLTEDELAPDTRASRCAGRSGYGKNDPTAGKEYSQNRRLRRPYRLIGRTSVWTPQPIRFHG